MFDFFLSIFKEPNVRWVLWGIAAVCASSALVGVFVYLQKRSLVGDAVSHAILPGICMAFIFTQTKNSFVLIIGAMIAGWLSLMSIDYITQKTKIKTDAATALVLSVFYGVGILLLTYIQKTGLGGQSGLDHFLFGRAAALVSQDAQLFIFFSVFVVFVIWLFYHIFYLFLFDKAYAQSLGFPVRWLEFLLSTLTVLVIALGIQAVGVVLMIALLVSPAASARCWTNNMLVMLVLSAFLGMFSGITGAVISYSMPHMPTGPWVVMVLTFIAFFSVFFGTVKGTVWRK